MAPTLNCNHEAPYAMYQTAHTLRGEGFDASEDGTGRGTPLVPVVAATLEATAGKSRGAGTPVGMLQPVAFDTTQITSAANYSNPKPGDPCHPLAAQAHVPCIAFSSQDNGRDATELIAPTMRKGGDGGGVQLAVAVSLRGREGGATAELGDEVGNCLRASGGCGDKPHVLTAMQVRRLTPEECEALQGFPRGYTAIAHRGKPAADGPRYKALGNSWAVPNVRWIFQRIDLVSNIKQMSEAA